MKRSPSSRTHNIPIVSLTHFLHRLLRVHVSIRQHQRRIILIHDIPRYATNDATVHMMIHWQVFR
jgi:hypothetical protein